MHRWRMALVTGKSTIHVCIIAQIKLHLLIVCVYVCVSAVLRDSPLEDTIWSIHRNHLLVTPPSQGPLCLKECAE